MSRIPVQVLIARDLGDFAALHAMQQKASRTRAKNRKHKIEAQAKKAEIDEVFLTRRLEQESALRPEVVRRDDLLPEDQL